MVSPKIANRANPIEFSFLTPMEEAVVNIDLPIGWC
jgi:hypothetical protein